MVVFTTALIIGLPAERLEALAKNQLGSFPGPPPLSGTGLAMFAIPGSGGRSPFPPEHFARIRQMGALTADLIGPDNCVPQIGDNDSGRFFRLALAFIGRSVRETRLLYANLRDYVELPDDAVYWDAIHWDHRHVVDAICGLLRTSDCDTERAQSSLDAAVVRGLARGVRAQPGRSARRESAGAVLQLDEIERRAAALPANARCVSRFDRERPGDLRDGLIAASYPEFGLYMLRSARVHVTFRCGGGALGRFAGHAHDDQLSVEIFVDGRRYVRDPGTYVYTPLPDRRDAYRSANAHWTPAKWIGAEARLDLGAFDARIAAVGRCLYVGDHAIVGKLRGPLGTAMRIVRVLEDAIEVEDIVEGAAALPPSPPPASALPYSPGYGLLANPAWPAA
jgi:hypothetical protein